MKLISDTIGRKENPTEKQAGHFLELIENGKKKIECVSRFDSERAIQIMINYLKGNIDWVRKYKWKTPAIIKLLDNLDRLRKSEFS